jgi:hypothetical protein
MSTHLDAMKYTLFSAIGLVFLVVMFSMQLRDRHIFSALPGATIISCHEPLFTRGQSDVQVARHSKGV